MDVAANPEESKSAAAPASRPLRRVALGGVVLVGVIVATIFYLDGRHYEATDDAFIDGNFSIVASEIAGRVVALGVHDNQEVAVGQRLVDIDARDYQVHLDQSRATLANARAAVAQAEAQVTLQEANVDAAMANTRVVEADLAKDQDDLKRLRGVNPAAISTQQLDDAASAVRSATARVDSSRRAVAAARAQLGAAKAQVEGARAQQSGAEADLTNAELQLSYTHVAAAVAGRVTKRSVEVGNYVTAGVALMTIVPKDVWVTANFKEVQIGRMHAGQAVEIRIDEYPGLVFHGQIDSFQNGTGAAFSTLPAENATGNYVKIVQRVPVKITLGPNPAGAPQDLRLFPGLSVRPRVEVN